MSCCALRPHKTSLNSPFQNVHVNEVKPRVPGYPRVPASGTRKADFRLGSNTIIEPFYRGDCIIHHHYNITQIENQIIVHS